MVIDTDVGDSPDDAFALAFAARCPEIRLLGVTTVCGETHRRAQLAQSILQRAGSSAPVLAGPLNYPPARREGKQFVLLDAKTGPPGDFGNAVDFLVESALVHQGRLVIAALGPLTNLASALLMYEQFAHIVKRVIFMGGMLISSDEEPNAGEPAEYNVSSDAVAARHVLSSSLQKMMVPLNATLQLDLPEGFRRSLRESSDPLHQHLSALTAFFPGRVFLHDVLAIAVSFRPHLIAASSLCVSINPHGFTVVDPFGKGNLEAALWVNRKEFFSLLASRLGMAFPY